MTMADRTLNAIDSIAESQREMEHAVSELSVLTAAMVTAHEEVGSNQVAWLLLAQINAYLKFSQEVNAMWNEMHVSKPRKLADEYKDIETPFYPGEFSYPGEESL